ncbi:MAG: hypothetical protein ACLGIO_07630 [Acidimicrobiia bacterium]
MKRMLKLAGATAVASALFTGTAYAHYCTNVSKKDGAGNAGVLFADVSSGDFTVVPEKSTVKMNSQGQITGGFMTIHVDFDGNGTPDLVLEDVYAHTGLPSGALLAAGCGQATETNVPFFDEFCPPTP